ncbi:hypothetical protein L873DRAFT_1669287 [Choiromyces venosus 120613-1]|uniref:Uncharacterized protein n=1 Tax=Choiromyces venosus 120613-1 TaxID=1336337 RepID=A0A3N4JZX2_9PEZI|nr:hypothetical protein L873DRAFT_1669287 [Choiromyces venosus 120613-1]
MHFLKRLVKSQKEATFRTRHSRISSGANSFDNDEDHYHSRNSSQNRSYNSSHAFSSSCANLTLHPSPASKAPVEVLMSIFSFICPHALDETYLSAEESTTELGCMLCDMRELSRCSLVCRSWHETAQLLQYRSIRLDSVHYCGLEEELQTRRKRGSFFQKQTSPLDIPEHRMSLLYRTFQENETTAMLTNFLKMPYMTRETCRKDLARLVSLLPNLRYVDLPDGVFQDESSCASLKAILYTRCPDLRKMSWVGGSEKNFVDLWIEPPWLGLEVVELLEMKIENRDLVQVLLSLPYLSSLKMKSMPWTTDAIFESTTTTDVGLFPALQTLTIEDSPCITIDGLTTYLTRPLVSTTLETLTLTNTPLIPPHQIHLLLPLAKNLTTLSMSAQVGRTIPHDTPLLASPTLSRLSYEITDDDASSAKSLAKPSPSYYAYLSTSFLNSALPRLKNLYVRELGFHSRLQASALSTTWTAQKLNLHTKDVEHLEWTKYSVGSAGGNLLVIPISPKDGARVSLFADFGDAPGSSGGGGGGRRGSFLAVPGEALPEFPGKRERRRRSRADLWR